MSLTNPNARTRLFGFNIANTTLYIFILGGLFIAFKIANVFTNLFRKVKTMLGFADDEDTLKNTEQIYKELEKDPGVKTQVNNGSRMIADQIYNAVNGFLFDDEMLYNAFKSITGPNHMKAIFLAYGTRTVTIIPFYNFSGDMAAMLRWRLTDAQYNKNLGSDAVRWSIRTKLNWLKT